MHLLLNVFLSLMTRNIGDKEIKTRIFHVVMGINAENDKESVMQNYQSCAHVF